MGSHAAGNELMIANRTKIALEAGMTHREAQAAIAVVWPHVVLRLYDSDIAFYREGAPFAEDALTDDDDVLTSPGEGHDIYPTTGPVELTGDAPHGERRGRIYAAFGLEASFDCPYQHLNWSGQIQWNSSLDQIQCDVAQMLAVFESRYGRPATVTDRFDFVVPKS